MTVPQQKQREIVFQLLYSHDIGGSAQEDQVSFLMGHHAVTKKTVLQALAKRDKILALIAEIDKKIFLAIEHVSFEQIGCIEKNIIRLAVYEICYTVDIPPKVAIAEAIRLGSKFASDEGCGFINAVLDKIFKTHSKEVL